MASERRTATLSARNAEKRLIFARVLTLSESRMRTLIAGLVGVWALLTVIAYSIVLPEERPDEKLILAYLELGPAGDGPAPELVRGYRADYAARNRAEAPTWETLRTAPDKQLAAAVEDFRSWYARTQGRALAEIPRLVWSTDDNPARHVQCQLFRLWHLRRYGEPLDIVTDPSNRDTTKTIVQCVAGAGPDVIESYGPAQLEQFVSAGVALDITDIAAQRGFGEDRVFPAAVSSMSKNGRQYAFPCNVGYTVLFYHRDLFESAGLPLPPASGGWTIARMLDIARTLTDQAQTTGRRRVGIMGLGAWGMSLADGATFFNTDGTASFYNNPKTIASFQAYQDLMYKHKVMPTPAELASMAAAGGANMNMGAEAASASALFSAKTCAMVSDGRWSYVAFAQRQRDRTIGPAMQRRIKALENASNPALLREREQLTLALESLNRDVLVPITDEQYRLMEGCLTDADQAQMLNLGVAHVPTSEGTPYYEAAARVAIVNRVSPRAELAQRFIEFLASDEYNNQINFTFDSISGTPEIIRRNGIAGPPRALPGLEAFDSPIFVEAMDQYSHPWELSPFIGRNRLGQLVGPIMEQLTNNTIGPAEAARVIEDRINAQIRANLLRDAELRGEWEHRTGKTFNPDAPLREQGTQQQQTASPRRAA